MKNKIGSILKIIGICGVAIWVLFAILYIIFSKSQRLIAATLFIVFACPFILLFLLGRKIISNIENTPQLNSTKLFSKNESTETEKESYAVGPVSNTDKNDNIQRVNPNMNTVQCIEPLVPEALKLFIRSNCVSASLLQRQYKCRYLEAVEIINQLEQLGYIQKINTAKYKILITMHEYNNLYSYQTTNTTKPSTKNMYLDLPYEELIVRPEYQVIKEYVSKLKVVETSKFISELSPYNQDITVAILATLTEIDKILLYDKQNKQFYYIGDESILSTIDSMSERGLEFEQFTVNLLSKNGFTKVRKTQGSGDYGIDVLAEKDGITYAIQCKCYSNSVGNKAVQEAYSGKDFYKCMVAVVFTNNYFTRAAIETAEQNNVLLWDRNKLIDFLIQAEYISK